eukprot:gene42279-57240_t
MPSEVQARYAVSLLDAKGHVIAGNTTNLKDSGTRLLPWTERTNEYEVPVSPVGNALVLRAQASRPSQGVVGNGLFWLVYTDVKRFDGSFKDAHNYIVTSPSIEGPWSDPIYVNSSGFDPSLFHDEDGRKWFIQMQWNHRNKAFNTPGWHAAFDGILCQEWDAKTGKLIGQIHNIFGGTELGLVEGAHIFRRNGWYYITAAEGGTGYDHAISFARSKSVTGPYEIHPDKYLLTAKGQALRPVLLTMADWGNQQVYGDKAPVTFVHDHCGHAFTPRLVCEHCGEGLIPGDLRHVQINEDAVTVGEALALSDKG